MQRGGGDIKVSVSQTSAAQDSVPGNFRRYSLPFSPSLPCHSPFIQSRKSVFLEITLGNNILCLSLIE